jgi:hypothetical protein
MAILENRDHDCVIVPISYRRVDLIQRAATSKSRFRARPFALRTQRKSRVKSGLGGSPVRVETAGRRRR